MFIKHTFQQEFDIVEQYRGLNLDRADIPSYMDNTQ